MIVVGDGSFERRLREGRCPKCTGYLEKDGDGAWCGICKLSIHDGVSRTDSNEVQSESEETSEAKEQRYAPYDNL